MHIAEGIVTGWPAVVSTGVGLGLMAVGANRMQAFTRVHPRQKPLLAMAGAFIFLLSLVPIPAFTGTCTHPCGSPLAGILLGPWIGMALSGLSLLLQAAFFSHGGFSTWGVNLIALGVGGAGGGWLVYTILRRLRVPVWIAAAAGGLLGDLLTYAISGFMLGGVLAGAPQAKFTFAGYLQVIYLAYLPTITPIALGEMVLTGLALKYIAERRPDVLAALRLLPPPGTPATPPPPYAPPPLPTMLLLGLLGLLLFAAPASRAQSPAAQTPAYQGMDESVNEHLAAQAGRPARDPYLPTEKLGDLWNTLLLLGGGACGFILGRNWDRLFGTKADPTPEEPS